MGRAIEPGSKFFVEYGDGKQIEVIAQTLRQKAEIGKVLSQSGAQSFQGMIDIINQISANKLDDSFFDTIDDTHGAAIITATISLTEAEQKKSE
jgi:hypothetical protein